MRLLAVSNVEMACVEWVKAGTMTGTVIVECPPPSHCRMLRIPLRLEDSTSVATIIVLYCLFTKMDTDIGTDIALLHM